MGKRVLILCDVDGCVAPMPYRKYLAEGYTPTELDYAFGNVKCEVERLTADPSTHFPIDSEHVVDMSSEYRTRKARIVLSSEMLDHIKKLDADPNVDFRWLSMWNERTQTVLNPLLGMDAPYLPTADHLSEMYEWFKSWAIQDMVKHGELNADAVVWLDDDHNRKFTTITYGQYTPEASRELFNGVPSLVLQVDKRWGISRAEMALVEDFVKDPEGTTKRLEVSTPEAPILEVPDEDFDGDF